MFKCSQILQDHKMAIFLIALHKLQTESACSFPTVHWSDIKNIQEHHNKNVDINKSIPLIYGIKVLWYWICED